MKQKKRVIAAAAIAVIIIAAVTAGGVLFGGRQSPEEVLLAYTEAAENQQYKEMYEMLDAHSRGKISEKEFTERNGNIYRGIGASKITVEPQEWDANSDSLSYLTVMNTSAGKIAFPNRMTFYKEDRQWKIRWTSQLIHPDLPEKGKVNVRTVPAVRGDILDRNGKLLAGEGTVFSVGLIPGQMNDSSDLGKLAELLDTSQSAIKKKLDAGWVTDGSFVPIRDKKDIGDIHSRLLEIPGVAINKVTGRVYPLEEAAAHLTGYVQDINAEELKEYESKGYTAQSVIGKRGLEALYEDRLHGTDGRRIFITNAKGVEIKVLAQKKPQDGEDIKTTIDVRMQKALYNEFRKDRSASAALNPKTGEVLALVSTPSFSSGDFAMGMPEGQWKKLSSDKDAPMVNRFRAVWCPGSSLKPLVAAAAITDGTLDPGENFGSSGRSWQKDGSWGSYSVTTLHTYGGAANLKNALIHSDNIYFAKLALKMGEKAYIENMKKLGFGKELPFPIVMEKSQYAGEEKIGDEIQLADSGYGQGQVLVNPLHLAVLYTAFVNEGNVVRPVLEKSEKSENAEPEYWIEGAFSKKAARIVKKDLVRVIEDPAGTGHGAKIDGMVLAGKTGTAELKASKDDTSGEELGWFTVIREKGGRPILIVSMTENVRKKGGSTYVVKKDKNVLKQLEK